MQDTITNNVANMANGFPLLSGNDDYVFGAWNAQINVHFDQSAPAIYKIPPGEI